MRSPLSDQQTEIPQTAPVLRRPRSWRLSLAVAGLAVMGALTAFVFLRPAATPVAAPPVAAQAVSVVRVAEQRLPRTQLLTGTVAAWDELPVGAERTGLRIERILVEEGERVRRGQLLAQFNDRPLRAQLRQVEAEIRRTRSLIAQQQASVLEAQALRREAETNRRRFDDLVAQGAVSALEAQSRRTGADTYGARVLAANQAVSVAEAELARAEARREELLAEIAQTRIVAPADGVVSRRQAKLGSVVSPLTSQSLFTLVRDSRLEMQAELSEVHLAAVRPGQTVALTSDAQPGRTFTGRVREIAPTVDASLRNATVRIDLPAEPLLRPGMFLRGRLAIGSAEVPVIPEGAVLYSDGRPFVFVVDGERARRQPVRLGERHAGVVEVREGLTAGMPLVLAGAGYLKDGDRIKVAGGTS